MSGIQSPKHRDLIRQGGLRVGVSLDDNIVEWLEQFVAELLRWNVRINLISESSASEVIERHVVDSLALVPHVPRDARVLDVGSGAGFPGLVLAAARPDISIVLLEPTAKKNAFLQRSARSLPASNASCLRDRIEHHASGNYDVAVSRATWAIPEWLTRARELVRPGGLILAMEARMTYRYPEGVQRYPYDIDGRTRAIIVCPTDCVVHPQPLDSPSGGSDPAGR